MQPSDETMRAFLREMQRIEPREVSVRRMADASAVVAEALAARAGQSLFDTEPDTLHLILDELAGDPRA